MGVTDGGGWTLRQDRRYESGLVWSEVTRKGACLLSNGSRWLVWGRGGCRSGGGRERAPGCLLKGVLAHGRCDSSHLKDGAQRDEPT